MDRQTDGWKDRSIGRQVDRYVAVPAHTLTLMTSVLMKMMMMMMMMTDDD